MVAITSAVLDYLWQSVSTCYDKYSPSFYNSPRVAVSSRVHAALLPAASPAAVEHKTKRFILETPNNDADGQINNHLSDLKTPEYWGAPADFSGSEQELHRETQWMKFSLSAVRILSHDRVIFSSSIPFEQQEALQSGFNSCQTKQEVTKNYIKSCLFFSFTPKWKHLLSYVCEQQSITLDYVPLKSETFFTPHLVLQLLDVGLSLQPLQAESHIAGPHGL